MSELAQTFSIDMNGSKREIFMSFAMLNICSALVGDPDNIALVSINPQLRKAVLEQVLAERDEKGKLIKEVLIDDVTIPFDQLLDLLGWVEEHLLNFTLMALEKAKARKDKNQAKLSNLMDSLLGANNLNSPKSPA